MAGPVIRKAVAADAACLPAIESSAAKAFGQLPELAWLADGDALPVSRHLELIDAGTVWVAETAAGPVGFLSAEVRGRYLHIVECSVHLESQGQGIGTKLVEAAARWSADQGLEALSLTTFRAVPWNEPFYRTVGFRVATEQELPAWLVAIMSAEHEAGLTLDQRCAMLRTINEAR